MSSQKKFGQNFLKDENIARKIIESNLKSYDYILEIGSGREF